MSLLKAKINFSCIFRGKLLHRRKIIPFFHW